MSAPLKPLTVPVSVAAILMGCSHETAYKQIRDGSLARLPLGGRWRISIAALEKIAGRAITIEEIEAALKIHAASRVIPNERQNAARAAKKASGT